MSPRRAPGTEVEGPRRTAEALALAARFAWPAAFVAVVAMTFSYLRDRGAEPKSQTRVEHAGPTVVRDLRAISRLETASLHMEKIVEVKDHQERLHGLVEADDAVLFVATGEVVLGVDLAKMGEDDARFDAATKTAYVTLPQPEVLSSRFDEIHSYVHSRKTDLMAERNEGLEGVARREAIAAFEKAARDPESMKRAREQAERDVRALGAAWGASAVVITWKEPRGEISVGAAPSR
jgi:hypothetical protein